MDAVVIASDGSIVGAGRVGGTERELSEGFAMMKISSDGKDVLWHKQVSDGSLLGWKTLFCLVKNDYYVVKGGLCRP